MTEVSRLLQSFASICISGPDALNLMQGQFTADLRPLLAGQSTYCAYCDVKGKIGWFFLVTYQDSKYYITLPAEMLASFLVEFKKYAVFSQVTISNVDEKIYGMLEDEQAAIYNKIPIISLANQFKYFPHDLRLAELKALSFTKGCFKGQEIVARMEHRGSLKRQSYVIVHEQPVENYSLVMAAEQEVGSIVRTAGLVSLAVITDSYLSVPLTVQQQPVRII